MMYVLALQEGRVLKNIMDMELESKEIFLLKVSLAYSILICWQLV